MFQIKCDWIYSEIVSMLRRQQVIYKSLHMEYVQLILHCNF